MTEPVYIIVEMGFNYDDNYYTQNNTGGDPIKYFKDKNLAEWYCDEKNEDMLIQLVESNDLRDYIEYPDDDLVKVLRKNGFKLVKNKYSFSIEMPESETITREQAKDILKTLGPMWFQVVKVNNSVNDIYPQKLCR